MNWRPLRLGVAAPATLITLMGCAHWGHCNDPVRDHSALRNDLSTGYSLLYQESDALPKLKWILMFKSTPGEMGALTNELVDYYQHLADTMRRLARAYPAMRIDLAPMSAIEAEARKGMGEDMAKELAPVVGKTGKDFQRDALLMFYDALDEQWHLTRVMAASEPDPGLHTFLVATEAQLQSRHAKVGALLERRYFTH